MAPVCKAVSWNPVAHRRVLRLPVVAFGLTVLSGWLLLRAAPVSMVPELPRHFRLLRPTAEAARAQYVAVEGQPFSYALRVETRTRPTNPWSIQLNVRTTVPVDAGDRLLASFWLRRVASSAQAAHTTFVFEKAGPDYEKSALRTFSLTDTNWHQFHVAFEARDAYAAGEAQVNFQLGYAPQTVEFGEVTMTNWFREVALEELPDDHTYAGREPEAAWRMGAAERIDRWRRAGLEVQVTDADGRPLPGASVHVQMLRHAFGFGAAVAGRRLLEESVDGDRYRGVVTQWFNRVVIENDLKWPQFEADPALARRTVAWLRARDIPVRGHNLVWPGWQYLPEDLPALADDPAALRQRIDRHILGETAYFAGQLMDWDVVNEPWSNHDLQDILGEGELVRWFQLARQADPQARLFINDYENIDAVDLDSAHPEGYRQIIADLLNAGAPLDGIGLQGHFTDYLTPPEQLLAAFDRFAVFGLPLLVTEFDVDTTDEALQADYTRDLLTAAFSHPAVDGVLTWGFWEGTHWRPQAAMFRRDWSLKPNGLVWSNLVFRTWWTDEQLCADAEGRAFTRAYRGRHRLQVAWGGWEAVEELDLAADTNLVVALPLRRVAIKAVRDNANLRLRWQAVEAEPGTLLEAPSLSGPWQPAAVHPVRIGDSWEAVVFPAGSSRFYRLGVP